jgi:hypothetical protein
MTERTFIDKNGNSWSWNETEETVEALKQLHQMEVKFAGNYQGPLYAPHPDLMNGKETN